MTKYVPLEDFLKRQTKDELRLGFDEVERILGASLPRSASEHQAWWANDPSHSQGKSWLAAGWKTENLSLSRRSVTFVRTSTPTSTASKPTATPSVSTPPTAPLALDPWGALAGTVTIYDETALTSPVGEKWDAEDDVA